MFLATEAAKHIEFLGMSSKFWIVMVVFALFLVAILTAAYNEDKTSGL